MKKLVVYFAMAMMFLVVPFSLNAAENTPETDNIETVTNEEFTKYFEDNRKIVTDENGNRITGTVEVEFRVNDHGVPSGIQVTKGFSREANREVIAMLIEGPKWTSTDGKRVRIVVEYK